MGQGNAEYRRRLAFLRLLEYARDHANTLTARHLDFYYKEVLQLKKRPAEPKLGGGLGSARCACSVGLLGFEGVFVVAEDIVQTVNGFQVLEMCANRVLRIAASRKDVRR